MKVAEVNSRFFGGTAGGGGLLPAAFTDTSSGLTGELVDGRAI